MAVEPYYDDGQVTIYNADCRDVLPLLDRVPLVIADPPYNGVLPDEWDNQWADDTEFLDWMRSWVTLLPVMDNGSVYTFCAPQLVGRVEDVIGETFRVIGNLVWDKGERRMGAAGSGIDVTALRTYWHAGTERIVFAEAKAGDGEARDASGYWKACESTKRRIIGDYLRDEFKRAGVTNRQIAALFPSRTGGMTGCVSNWLIGYNVPTAEQYATMRAFLNRRGGDFLRREYDFLRREYEDLRRPFFLEKQYQWGDVWRFDPPRVRVHPAQKPLGMIEQVVNVSSRKGDMVLDPFMGSGTTLVAARDSGRKAIGIETDERNCELAVGRLRQKSLLCEA